MTATSDEGFWERVHVTFEEALDRPAEDRAAWIRATLSEAPEAARAALALLAHHEDDPLDSFLVPPAEVGTHSGADEPDSGPQGLPDLAGQTIGGRYEIGERIGAGGAGVVYRAKDMVTRRSVALKAMSAAMDARALRHEAAILRALRLPGVVQLLDDGVSEDGLAYIVTEFVEGTHFPGAQSRTWEQMERTVVALLETLERMHRSGIVHRDLKPGNVVVRSDGLPVVLDLGLSEPIRLGTRGGALHESGGTLQYMAPEQLSKGRWSPSSDLFALGAMLHEALSGRALRSGLTAEFACAGVMPASPPPLEDCTADVPADVCTVVNRMLATEPSDRPASAREILEALPDRFACEVGLSIEHALERPEDLRRLFHGPDRLQHLREDAARVLWQRSGGRPADVRAELGAWDRAGLGHFEAGRFRIDRVAIERLRAGLRVARPRSSSGRTTGPVDEAALELLLVIELAGARATTGLLASVLGQETGSIEAQLTPLLKRGLVQKTASYLEVHVPPRALSARTSGDVRALHRRIADALEAGDEHRILHRIAAGEVERVPREAIAIADQGPQVSEPRAKHVAILEGLRCLTPAADPKIEGDLLERLLESTLIEGTRAAFDELLFRLSRGRETQRIRELERVARSALRALEGDSAGALADVPDPLDPKNPRVRGIAFSVRLFALRGLPLDKQPALLAEAEVVAEKIGTAEARYQVVSARAWLAYAEDRYRDAARLHLEARTDSEDPRAFAGSGLNAASAYLEAGDFDQAVDLAHMVATFARDRRNAYMEARAERVLRAAAYRRGDVLVPDALLVEAAGRVHPYVGAMVALTEAGVAWRLGRRDESTRLATSAATAWRASQSTPAALLAESLALANGAPDLESGDLLPALAGCPPRLVVQAAALIAIGAPHRRAACRVIVEASATDILDDRATCLELLSVDEAFGFTAPGSAPGM